MTNGYPEWEITFKGQTYLLRVDLGSRGEPLRVAAWCEGREVYALPLARFMPADPKVRAKRAQAIEAAFDQVAKDVLCGQA